MWAHRLRQCLGYPLAPPTKRRTRATTENRFHCTRKPLVHGHAREIHDADGTPGHPLGYFRFTGGLDHPRGSHWAFKSFDCEPKTIRVRNRDFEPKAFRVRNRDFEGETNSIYSAWGSPLSNRKHSEFGIVISKAKGIRIGDRRLRTGKTIRVRNRHVEGEKNSTLESRFQRRKQFDFGIVISKAKAFRFWNREF